jgi:hypothetical protein
MQAQPKGRQSRRNRAMGATRPELLRIPFTVADVAPNSSALLAITMLPDLQEALAVLRTAALLARSFNSQLCIDISGTETLVVDTANDLGRASFQRMCGSIQDNLRKMTSNGSVLVLEAGLTAASFLRAGTVSVRIHAQEAAGRRQRV